MVRKKAKVKHTKYLVILLLRFCKTSTPPTVHLYLFQISLPLCLVDLWGQNELRGLQVGLYSHPLSIYLLCCTYTASPLRLQLISMHTPFLLQIVCHYTQLTLHFNLYEN